MSRSLALFLALAAVTSLHAGPVAAQEQGEAAANATVVISIPQDRITSSIDIGRVAAAPSGGILDTIIIRSMDNKKEILSENAQQRADANLAPLAEALAGFSIADLALEATRKGWRDAEVLSPDSVPGSGGSAVTLVTYLYQTSPDFTQIQVIASVAGPGESGATMRPRQTVISSVRLGKRSYEESENVARWAADNGRLAKEGLAKAFARLEAIVPAVMALSDAEFEAATNKKRESAFAGGYYGPVLMRDDIGPVIWSKGDGFVAVTAAGD